MHGKGYSQPLLSALLAFWSVHSNHLLIPSISLPKDQQLEFRDKIDFGANVFDREIVLCTNLIILFLLFFLEVKHCLTFSDAVNFHPQRRRSGI